MSDVTKKAAELAGKPADQYRVDEFKNDEGGYSACLVDNMSGSITLQANSHSAVEARKRLEEAVVENGNLVKLDPAIVPDTKSKDWHGLDGVERRDTASENRVKRVDAGRVTDGYAVLTPSDSNVTSEKSPVEVGPKPKDDTTADPDPATEKKQKARRDAHAEELGKK